MARRSKKTVVEEAPKVAPEVEVKVEVEVPVVVRYFTAPDKHVNCRRGVIKPNTEVFPADFPGGVPTIEEHIENGGIVKR